MPGTVLAALAGVALVLPTQAAARSAADVAATQALSRATNTLVSAARPDVSRALTAVKHYANQMAAQCPGVAAGSPQNHDSQQLDFEVAGTLTATGYHVAAGPIATFAHAVKRLHWSNSRLTRAVHTFATKLVGLSTLAVPDLCTDIGAWVSTHYATLPASTTQFIERYEATDVEAEESPLIIRLARPYGTPGELVVLRRVERLETQLAEAEAEVAADEYPQLMDALDLQQ